MSISLPPPTPQSLLHTSTNPIPPQKLQPRSQHRGNKNGPIHQYQVNHDLIYEQEFHGEAYVSAHLQRLQHGVFTHSNVHIPSTQANNPNFNVDTVGEGVQYVTFIAIAFTFHPCNSENHRFKGAVITVKCRNEDDGEELRILKFAPHLAFGKISSANMKWNFSLGASVGVSQSTPVNTSVTGCVSEEKQITIGAMMKIQGSTRSTPPTLNSHKRKPDTVLVWSLEENSQQEAGLPREFTFVFLIERPTPSTLLSPQPTSTYPNEKADPETIPMPAKKPPTPSPASISHPNPHTSQPSKPPKRSIFGTLKREFSPSKSKPKPSIPNQEISPPLSLFPRRVAISKMPTVRHLEREKHVTLRQTPLSNPTPAPDNLDGIKEEISRISENIASLTELEQPVYYTESSHGSLTAFQRAVFRPLRISISVKPNITGAPSATVRNLMSEFEDAVVDGMVGQRFPTFGLGGVVGGGEEENEGDEEEWVNGLYNFAMLPGSFEDLVELPGNSVSSVEPTLDSGAEGGGKKGGS